MNRNKLFLVSVCMAAFTSAQETQEEWASAGKSRATWFARIHDRMQPQTFYGKVTDQGGTPLIGAEVHVSWEDVTVLSGKQSGNHCDLVQTDGAGCWKITLNKPHRAFISEVVFEGYAYVEDDKNYHRDLLEMRTTWETPVVSIMRKRGRTTFLIISPSGNRECDPIFQAKGTYSVSQSVDLLAWKSDPGWKYCATTEADLRVDAVFDTGRKCWDVTYSITNGPGGVVLSDKMLYEAPEDGYVPSASATLTNCYNLHKYVYVKSRSPMVYSRVLFVHDVGAGTNPSLRVSCKAWVNPYGDRSLEYDDLLENNWRVRKALTAESIQAIRSKRIVPRPDVERRIRETKERVAFEEAEQERRHKEWLEEMKKLKKDKSVE